MTDITACDCTVKWRPPLEDGGAPVRGYIIEVQDKSGQWRKLGEAGRDTKFKVKELIEFEEYKYRVKAFNEVGESDPLNSEPMIARNPFSK